MEHAIKNPIPPSTPESARLLVVARCRGWMGIARLPKALQKAGFKVAVLCYPDAFLAKTRYVDSFYFCKEPEHSDEEFCQIMARAIADWKPGLVVPGDEPTVHLMHWAAQNRGANATIPEEVSKVILRSLGSTQHFHSTINKNETCRVASELGLRVPEQVQARGPEEALRFYVEHSRRPVVIKAPHGWAGIGVRVCANKRQLLAAFNELSKLEGVAPKTDDRTSSEPSETEQRAVWSDSRSLNVQRFISGKPGMYSAVAVKGELLAGYGTLKEKVYPAVTGPSAVVRFIDNPEMTATARVLIEHFQYTGFIEFCFMVEENAGYAYLLECNPRPAPIAPLGAHVGVDLCQALFDRLNGKSPQSPAFLKCGTVIAIFPQEWRRDPESALLRSECHDVPWDDTELLRALIEG